MLLNRAYSKIGVLFTLFALASCTTSLPETSSAPRHLEAPAQMDSGNDIPDIVSPLPLASEPQPESSPELYSVVAQDVPVRELLFAMARDADINIDVNPAISGQINLNAIDQTLPQILERIARQVDIRWSYDENNNLIIEPDTEYWQSYRVDYVNVERTATTDVDISTSIASVGGTDNGGGNNSSATISQSSTNSFWASLEANLNALLADTSGAEEENTNSPVVINSESGLINVFANSKQQQKVQEFIRFTESRSLQQVMIEATVVEVKLSDSFQSGVDWNSVVQNGANINPGVNNGNALDFTQTVTDVALNNSLPLNILTISSDNSDDIDINATVSLLSQFGDLRVLSSPKIMALNNQAALLRVVDNRVYFNVEVEPAVITNGVATQPTFTTTINTVPVGFVMTVTPQIGQDNQVTLNVRPTISRILRFVNDPNPALADAGVVNAIPEIQINEMESVLKVSSGQIAVLGGLMQDSLRESNDGLPFLSRLPGIGRAFSYQSETAEKTELVVFIRPIVIQEASITGDLSNYSDFLPANGLE